MTAYGIGRTMFSNTYQSFMTGTFSFGQPRNGGLTHESRVAISWMQMTFNRIGDIMPDSLTVHLPSYLDFKILYGICEDRPRGARRTLRLLLAVL